MSICFFFRHKAIAVKTRLLSSFFYRLLCIIFIAPTLAYAHKPIYLIYVSNNGVLHQVYRINNIGLQKKSPQRVDPQPATLSQSEKSVYGNRIFTNLRVQVEDYSPLSGAWLPADNSAKTIPFSIDKCFSIYETKNENDYPKKCAQACIYWAHININDCGDLKPVMLAPTGSGSTRIKEEPLEQIPSLFTFPEIPGIIALDLGLPNTAMMVTLLPPDCKISKDEEAQFYPADKQMENHTALKTTRLDQIFCIGGKPQQYRATFFEPSERTIINYDVPAQAMGDCDDREEPSSSTCNPEDESTTNKQNEQSEQRKSLFYKTDYSKSVTGASIQYQHLIAKCHQEAQNGFLYFSETEEMDDDTINKALEELGKPLKEPQLVYFHTETDEDDETDSKNSKERIIYIQANDSFDHIDAKSNVAIDLPKRIGKESKDPIIKITDSTNNSKMTPSITVYKWNFALGFIPFTTKSSTSIYATRSHPQFKACGERLNIRIKLYGDDDQEHTAIERDATQENQSSEQKTNTLFKSIEQITESITTLTKEINALIAEEKRTSENLIQLKEAEKNYHKEQLGKSEKTNTALNSLNEQANLMKSAFTQLFYPESPKPSKESQEDASILENIWQGLYDLQKQIGFGSKLTEEESKNGTESSADDAKEVPQGDNNGNP